MRITRITLRWTSLLAAAALTTIAGIANAQPSTPSGPNFDVASIRPASTAPSNYHIKIAPGRVDIASWSLRQLILRAYGLPAYRLLAPAWTGDSRFDVMAVFPQGATRDQLPDMLQWLLADRFGLAAHGEVRELSGFSLVVGKGGLKMKLAVRDVDDPPEPASANRLERAGQLMDRLDSNDPKEFGMSSMKAVPAGLHMEFKRLPMEALAQILADRLQVPVINGTGLAGEYQASLDLPLPGSSIGNTPPDSQGASISLSSTVESLGLKLEKQKSRISLLVVDHVDRLPTQN